MPVLPPFSATLEAGFTLLDLKFNGVAIAFETSAKPVATIIGIAVLTNVNNAEWEGVPHQTFSVMLAPG